MESSKQLASRCREVLLNGKWIANINFKEAISDITFEQAVQKVGSLNTIAALTFHIDYYVGGVLNVFEGGSLDIRDQYSFDLPPLASSADWIGLRDRLISNAEKFADHVECIPDSKLDDPFVDEKYGTYRRNIEGMIEHCYYHLGQVALLKKMIKVAI